MIEPKAQAAVNLHAVLRDLEDLVALDPVGAQMVADAHTRVTFRIPGIAPLALTFTEGTCTASATPPPLPPGHGDVRLAFASPRHLNALIAGRGVPLPTRGFRHLGFLQGPFTQLTGRLEQVLRPAPDGRAPSPAEDRLATTLTAYVAFFALAEVANHDTLGRANAARMADGDIAIEVAGGPTVTVHVAAGRLRTTKGLSGRPRARMSFDSLETAGGVLRGTQDTYAAMGSGRLAVSGYIPLLDHMNKLLAIVARYLA